MNSPNLWCGVLLSRAFITNMRWIEERRCPSVSTAETYAVGPRKGRELSYKQIPTPRE